MTEGERERIKHKANFYNGLGLVFFAAVSFGSAFRVLHSVASDADTWTRSLNFGKFFVIVALGILVAGFAHAVGQAHLKKLDN